MSDTATKTWRCGCVDHYHSTGILHYSGEKFEDLNRDCSRCRTKEAPSRVEALYEKSRRAGLPDLTGGQSPIQIATANANRMEWRRELLKGGYNDRKIIEELFITLTDCHPWIKVHHTIPNAVHWLAGHVSMHDAELSAAVKTLNLYGR